MSISQKINVSRFFSPIGTLPNNNFSSNQNLFNYLNNYSYIQQPLIEIQPLNNFLCNFNNSININNITINNIPGENEHPNSTINEKNEANKKINKEDNKRKTGEEEDFKSKWKTEKCHNLEIYGQKNVIIWKYMAIVNSEKIVLLLMGMMNLRKKIKNIIIKQSPANNFLIKGFAHMEVDANLVIK